MAGIRILGHGLSQGDEVISNFDLEKIVRTSDSWIREKTGIEQRFFSKNKSNLDMAEEAAVRAIENSSVEAKDIDLILVCTFTPDYATPSVACGIAGRLNLGEGVMCLDINAACSGFVYGLSFAKSMLETKSAKCVLLIGSEKISPLLDMEDRGTCILFGDGAGALILAEDSCGEFESSAGVLYDDEVLFCERFEPRVSMKGQEVYRFAVNKVPETIRTVLEKSGSFVEDVDWFIFHQANLRIIDSAAAKLKIPANKLYKNIQMYGNTSGASIGICIAEMREKGLLKNGMKVVCCGFGAGLTYGAAVFTVGE